MLTDAHVDPPPLPLPSPSHTHTRARAASLRSPVRFSLGAMDACSVEVIRMGGNPYTHIGNSIFDGMTNPYFVRHAAAQTDIDCPSRCGNTPRLHDCTVRKGRSTVDDPSPSPLVVYPSPGVVGDFISAWLRHA